MQKLYVQFVLTFSKYTFFTRCFPQSVFTSYIKTYHKILPTNLTFISQYFQYFGKLQNIIGSYMEKQNPKKQFQVKHDQFFFVFTNCCPWTKVPCATFSRQSGTVVISQGRLCGELAG